MPLPPGTSTVTVTEDYTRTDGTVPRVKAIFELSAPLYVDDTTIVIDPIEVDVADGQLSVQLAALPAGYAYRVTQIVDGRREPTRHIPLPASPTTVVLHELGEVEPVVPGVIRVVSVDGHLPDATGNIDLPAGGGGGVVSVNNQVPDGTGNVTLTAAHVGALTQAAGDSRYVQPAGLDPYATDADLATGLAGKAAAAHTHVQSDVSGLAGTLAAKADLVGGKIPQSQMPAVALVDYLGTVASQAAMLALTGQRGDWATRTDTGTTWQLVADDSTQLSSWQEHTYPASPVQSVAGRTGAVGLAKGDVGLAAVDNTSDAAKPVSTATQAALDGKEPAGAAATALAAHTAASDPHPQYLTAAEGDAVYATSDDLDSKENTGVAATLLAVHTGAANPHAQYALDSDVPELAGVTDFPTAIGPFNDPGGSVKAARADHTHSGARLLIVRQAWITSGDVTLPNTAGSWAPLTGFELAIPAAIGDYVDLSISAMRLGNANAMMDIGVLVGSSIVRFLASGSATPGLEGDPAWYLPSGGFVGHPGERGFTVVSGDRDGSNVRFAVVVKADGTGKIHASSNYPMFWRAKNYGPVS